MHRVIVVGGSGLIGSALCEVLNGAGYDVVGMSRNHPAENLKRFTSSWILGDIATENGIENVVDACNTEHKVSIVLCCGNHGENTSLENQVDNYNTNLVGLTRIWSMLEKQPDPITGSVLVCSSLMSSLPDRHYPFYAASKAGVDQFVRSLRKNRSGIAVASLVLGPVGTSDRAGMRSSKEVAEIICKRIERPKSGILYYPFYLGILSTLIKLWPNIWEQALLRFRKKPD